MEKLCFKAISSACITIGHKATLAVKYSETPLNVNTLGPATCNHITQMIAMTNGIYLVFFS